MSALCDGCSLPISGTVWIVAGQVLCFGTCRTCGEWVSVRELSERLGGGRWDYPTGVCQNCAKTWKRLDRASVEVLIGQPLR